MFVRALWVALLLGGCGAKSTTRDGGSDGGGCASGAECESGVCADGVCAEPSCEDTVRNGDETGPDCGGPCDPCPIGSACVLDADCASGRCSAGICAALTPLGEACAEDAECASGICRAFGASSVCSESCTTTCSAGGLACFDGFCTPSDYCESPDGFGRGPGCTGSECDRCAATATCVEQPGGAFSCMCNAGYSGDGVSCADVDECALGTDDCDANATCTDEEGTFSCACDAGYSGDGRACADVDECALGTDDCHANATCTNGDGGFGCACNGGYTGDGRSCADVDECALGTDDCHAEATCTNTTGAFTCACPIEMTGDGRSCAYFSSCRALRAARAGLLSGTYTIDTGTGGPIDVRCDMASDGGVGYTMVRFDDPALGGAQAAYRSRCAAYGMELIVPRTRAHAQAIRAWNGTVPNLVGVYPRSAGATGLNNWEGRCRGAPCRFWLSNSNNAGCLGFEPNGDNNPSDALYLADPSVCDYGHWNDANGAVAIPGYVICSTNDADPVPLASCRQLAGVNRVHNAENGIDGTYTISTSAGLLNVRCDMTTDGGTGYTMVRFDDPALGGAQADYRAYCAARGLEVIVPRTQAHANSISAWNGNAVPNLVNVFPRFNGATGLSNWEGRCRGAPCGFWLSTTNNSDCLGFEPNGDNNVNDALYFVGAGCDWGRWNDANGAVALTGQVICSTNDNP